MRNARLFFIFSTLLIFCFSLSLKAQDITDGLWYNEEKDAKIEIFKNDNGKYEGKIVWLKRPEINGKPRLDRKNKDKDKRDRKLMGLHLVTGMEKKGNQFKDGEIYDPKSGKTYSAKMTPDGKDKLDVRGYIGISLIGRTTTWTRTKEE